MSNTGKATNQVADTTDIEVVRNMVHDTITAVWTLADSGHGLLTCYFGVRAACQNSVGDERTFSYKYVLYERSNETLVDIVDVLIDAIELSISTGAYSIILDLDSTCVCRLEYETV